jgi:NADH-quinone oxidoreductase subunit L
MYHLLSSFLPLLGALIAGVSAARCHRRPASNMSTSRCSWPSSCRASCPGSAFFTVAMGDRRNLRVHGAATGSDSGGFSVDWAFRIDTLTAVMLVVVNTVSALVHIYSIGYMSHDPHRPRFFAYLSLFTFAMLMLVTSDNLLQMFFGWEGVGVASYLLIGFWYKKPSANAAAIKAFIVNRVGDFGFLLGIFGVFMLFGSVEFDAIFAGVADDQG